MMLIPQKTVTNRTAVLSEIPGGSEANLCFGSMSYVFPTSSKTEAREALRFSPEWCVRVRQSVMY